MKKHIADQFEMPLGRPFRVHDKVVVTPEPGDTFESPFFGEIVGVISRDQNNQPVEPVLAIRAEKADKDTFVYSRQCILRK